MTEDMSIDRSRVEPCSIFTISLQCCKQPGLAACTHEAPSVHVLPASVIIHLHLPAIPKHSVVHILNHWMHAPLHPLPPVWANRSFDPESNEP